MERVCSGNAGELELSVVERLFADSEEKLTLVKTSLQRLRL